MENPAGAQCSESDAGLHSEHFKRLGCMRSSLVTESPWPHCSACVFCKSNVCRTQGNTHIPQNQHCSGGGTGNALFSDSVAPCLQCTFAVVHL